MYIKNWKKNQAISEKDIKSNKKLREEIVTELWKCYNKSQSAVSAKLELYKRIDDKVKSMNASGKMTYDLLFQMKKTFVAMFKNEWISPVYTESDFNDRDVAQKLNKIVDFDQKVMRKHIKDKEMLYDVFDYGVWIRIPLWWNRSKQVVDFINIDPLCWYPDTNGNVMDNNFDFHLMSRSTSIGELKSKESVVWWYFDLDEVQAWQTLSEQRSNLRKKQQRLITQMDSYNDPVYVLNCFVCINGRKYFCTLANAHSKIIKREEIKPLTPLEKKYPDTIPFPVAISNSFPLIEDPWGISYRELMYPTQITMTKLINAMQIKEMREAGFDNYFVDVRAINNINDLLDRAESWPKFIPVDSMQGQITQPVQELNNTNQSQQFFQYIQKLAEDTTWLTGIVRWLSPDTNTLWDTELQLQRSNVVFDVDADNLMIWEQMFWEVIYMRYMRKHVRDNWWKKVTQLLDDDWELLKITEQDFISGLNPTVEVFSSKKRREDNMRKLSNMQSILPIVLQDPNVSPISAKMFKREMYRKMWFDDAFIESIEPMDSSERHSLMMKEMISSWLKPQNIFIPWLDLQTLWIYINSAINNELKFEVLSFLNTLMIREWVDKPKPVWEWLEMTWIANSMASQAMTNNIVKTNESLDNKAAL